MSSEIFLEPSEILVSTSKGLSKFVEKEIEQLGFEPFKTMHTGVWVNGTLQDCIALNYFTRCAYNVHYLIDRKNITNAQELYDWLVSIPFEKYIDPHGYFCVDANVINQDEINNTMFAALKVKDAVVDRIREKSGVRPDSGSDRTQGVALYLFWKDDEAGIFINTSGDTISRHGYRKIPGMAPLQESLAAGIVAALEWNPETPFVNPMCGSGTLAIEAALLATGRFTYHSRNEFAFKQVKGYNRLLAAEVLERMPMQQTDSVKIYASDINPTILSGAKQNAKMAGVEQFIQFELSDYRDVFIPQTETGGAIVINPPYGKRLEDPELNMLYKSVGDFFKQKGKGYNGFVFTGNLEALKFLGLKSYFKLQMYSAQLECRLAGYKLF